MIPKILYPSGVKGVMQANYYHWFASRRFTVVPAGFEFRLPHRWMVPADLQLKVAVIMIVHQWLSHKPKGATAHPAPGIYDGHPQAMVSAQRLGPGDPDLAVAAMMKQLPWWLRVVVRVTLWGASK